MLLNIIATALPTFVLQLLILPVLSKYMESSADGLLVTILALLNVIPATMGNSLNNIRLIDNETKYMQKQTADYNVILLIMTGLNIIMVALFSLLYDFSITISTFLLVILQRKYSVLQKILNSKCTLKLFAPHHITLILMQKDHLSEKIGGL